MIQAEEICFNCIPVLRARLALFKAMMESKFDMVQLYQEMKLWFDIKAIAKILNQRVSTIEPWLHPIVNIDPKVTYAVLVFKDALLYNREENHPLSKFSLACKNCGHDIFKIQLIPEMMVLAREADLEDLLWKPAKLDLNTADQLIPMLEKAMIDLQKRADYYKQLSPTRYSQFVAIISLILNACKQNPRAKPRCREIKKKKIQIPEKTDSKIMDNDLKDEIDKGEKIEKSGDAGFIQ